MKVALNWLHSYTPEVHCLDLVLTITQHFFFDYFSGFFSGESCPKQSHATIYSSPAKTMPMNGFEVSRPVWPGQWLDRKLSKCTERRPRRWHSRSFELHAATLCWHSSNGTVRRLRVESSEAVGGTAVLFKVCGMSEAGKRRTLRLAAPSAASRDHWLLALSVRPIAQLLRCMKRRPTSTSSGWLHRLPTGAAFQYVHPVRTQYVIRTGLFPSLFLSLHMARSPPVQVRCS